MALSERAALQLLTLLAAAGSAAQEAARTIAHGCAECAHLDTSHNLNSRGQRAACSVTEGADGARCPCRAFHPLTGTEL